MSPNPFNKMHTSADEPESVPNDGTNTKAPSPGAERKKSNSGEDKGFDDFLKMVASDSAAAPVNKAASEGAAANGVTVQPAEAAAGAKKSPDRKSSDLQESVTTLVRSIFTSNVAWGIDPLFSNDTKLESQVLVG